MVLAPYAIHLHISAGFVNRHFLIENFPQFLITFELNTGKILNYGNRPQPLSLYVDGYWALGNAWFMFAVTKKTALMCVF